MEIAPHSNDLLLRRAVEALLFEASAPVLADAIARTFARVTSIEVTEEQVEAAVEALRLELLARGSAVQIHRWAGGYRMATHPDYAAFLEAAKPQERPRKLSPSLLETLTILAYRQPVTKPELDFVRGVDTDYALSRLMELGFADVVGRGEGVGRPLLYGTTPRFLESFGLNSLEDLPSLREVESILADPAFNHERARLLALDAPSSPSTEPASRHEESR